MADLEETERSVNSFLFKNGRKTFGDFTITRDLTQEQLINRQFVRLVAIGRTFEQVNFNYCTFDAAYLRDCEFNQCTFWGCTFLNSNLIGSSFKKCEFKYAVFRFTFVDNKILHDNRIEEENLSLKFARSLRVNYQQIGDFESANKAIDIELEATRIHKQKKWVCPPGFYEINYGGWEKRIVNFLGWLWFRANGFVWGHGESLVKLGRSVFVLHIILIVLVYILGDVSKLNFWDTVFGAPSIFFQIGETTFPDLLTTVVYATRLIITALFISIVIRRNVRR